MAGRLGVGALVTLPEFIERDADNLLEVRVTTDGTAPTLTAGTCTVYRRSGAIVSTGAATVNDEAGLARYTVTSSSVPATMTLEEGWRVRWELTPATGEPVRVENSAMLVRCRLQCPVTVQSLWLEAPGLNPGGADPVTVMSAAEQDLCVQMAWVKVQQRLLEAGRRPFLIIGAYALMRVTTDTALSDVYAALAARGGRNQWSELSDKHRRLAEAAWRRVQAEYDEDQDGVSDARRKAGEAGPTWLGGY